MRPYVAKSLKAAQTRVHQLEKALARLDKLAARFKQERRVMAMLAADGPVFFYPLQAIAAKIMRDNILRHECHLKPDGSPLS